MLHVRFVFAGSWDRRMVQYLVGKWTSNLIIMMYQLFYSFFILNQITVLNSIWRLTCYVILTLDMTVHLIIVSDRHFSNMSGFKTEMRSLIVHLIGLLIGETEITQQTNQCFYRRRGIIPQLIFMYRQITRPASSLPRIMILFLCSTILIGS